MLGFRFSEYKPDPNQSTFDRLFKIFQELLLYTSVDVGEGVGMNGLKLLQADIKLATSRVIMICFLILFSFLKMRLL